MNYPSRTGRAAFTLVEVVLAILIISAIITVLLYFYQRTAEVRTLVLDEAEYLAVSRMFMEQVTGELRTARVVEDQFVGLQGTSNSITFVCTGIPQTPRWIVNTNEAVVLPPATDLKRVSYHLLTGTNSFEIRGIDRTEALLTDATSMSGTNAASFLEAGETNALAEAETNLLGALGTNDIGTNAVEIVKQPLTSKIKHLQFRYWGGTNWVDEWNSLDLPSGVEITIGRDPLSPDSVVSTTPEASEEFDPEVFRRVVYLPNSIPPANRVALPDPAESF